MDNGSDGKIEDDGIDILQQVLAENPPEERGEREEWDQHTGWNRKEDLYKKPSLRGVSSMQTPMIRVLAKTTVTGKKNQISCFGAKDKRSYGLGVQ